MAILRRPVVAGRFYEGTAEALKAQIESCFLNSFGPRKLPKVNIDGPRQILGLVCPHAGYVYSGSVAANAFFELANDGKPILLLFLVQIILVMGVDYPLWIRVPGVHPLGT
jgi:AmmeMemoRadiSam system protein B